MRMYKSHTPEYHNISIHRQVVAQLNWGTGPFISLCGPTKKIFPYHVIQLITVVP